MQITPKMFKTSIAQSFWWRHRHFFLIFYITALAYFIWSSLSELGGLYAKLKMFSPSSSKKAQFKSKFGIQSYIGAKVTLQSMNHGAAAATVSITGWGGGKKTTSNTISILFYSSSEKCCILPVPFYNNTSIIITVAKMKRREEKNRRWETERC